jgi:hypothetical protein
MAFLNLTRYQHPSGLAFDPDKVIQRVKAEFREATVLPGDQLAEEARRAEDRLGHQLKENPEGPARRVVESLRRKAEAYGPAYAFAAHLPPSMAPEISLPRAGNPLLRPPRHPKMGAPMVMR